MRFAIPIPRFYADGEFDPAHPARSLFPIAKRIYIGIDPSTARARERMAGVVALSYAMGTQSGRLGWIRYGWRGQWRSGRPSRPALRGPGRLIVRRPLREHR